MFSIVTIFKCLNQAVLVADVGCCKFEQENQSEASEKHQILLNALEWKRQKQQDECN